jgi:hypothetical protein
VFITFNIWAGIFCLFNTVVFIIDLAKSTIDPEKIVLVVMFVSVR